MPIKIITVHPLPAPLPPTQLISIYYSRGNPSRIFISGPFNRHHPSLRTNQSGNVCMTVRPTGIPSNGWPFDGPLWKTRIRCTITRRHNHNNNNINNSTSCKLYRSRYIKNCEFGISPTKNKWKHHYHRTNVQIDHPTRIYSIRNVH